MQLTESAVNFRAVVRSADPDGTKADPTVADALWAFTLRHSLTIGLGEYHSRRFADRRRAWYLAGTGTPDNWYCWLDDARYSGG